VRVEVLMAESMKMAVLWVVVPCVLVDTDRHFGGACCLHQSDRRTALHSTATQKTAIFGVTVVVN
jgi:hypothetical protein